MEQETKKEIDFFEAESAILDGKSNLHFLLLGLIQNEWEHNAESLSGAGNMVCQIKKQLEIVSDYLYQQRKKEFAHKKKDAPVNIHGNNLEQINGCCQNQ
ncbi:hypothetical protein [Desulforhopalus singaporensis]|uniref:Uncharacterized protein n=1 Tax=Desulforhopalus singaporensis TaxID=91360 RepID=A0A1H0VBW6_9BACT|nr:hypothetical protein [Desulforhopalus singaporensis]SDP75947.1 hypothetical protein SAMN05660330_03984 [Desulforhopalus singaporensis]